MFVCVCVCVFLVLTLIPVVWRIHLVDQISDFVWNKNIKHLFLPGRIVWMESLEAQAEGSTGGEGVWTLGVAASVPWRQQALCGKILSCGSSHPVPFPRVSANFQTCLTHQFSKLVGIFPTTSFLPKLPRFCWQLLGSDLQVVPVT